MINRKFDLNHNYRNTAEILRAAKAFSARPAAGAEGVLALPVEPDTAIPSGRRVGRPDWCIGEGWYDCV